jgi:hypothetical protein
VEQYFEDFYEYAKGKTGMMTMKQLKKKVEQMIADGSVY